MSSRMEEMITALLNGGTVDFQPHSRMEQYLQNCIDGSGTEGLPIPDCRAEVLLYELAENISAGSGGDVSEEDIATNDEVIEVLDDVFN